MKIVIYGKPKCPLCTAAKEKLDRLHLEYEVRDLFSEAWREDENGYTDAMAKHAMIDTLPVITVDGRVFSYPEAMKFLKEIKSHGKEKANRDGTDCALHER
jgi:glutaredoxin